MSELDLEHGDPDAADRLADDTGTSRISKLRSVRKETGAAGAGKRPTGGGRPSASKRASAKSENTLGAQLADAFTKLAEQLKAKGDDELATAIEEEKEGMSVGLLSMTRVIPFLRRPLLVVLGIAIPVLAFWRVGGILMGRMLERRARILAERQMMDAQEPGLPVTPVTSETVPGSGY